MPWSPVALVLALHTMPPAAPSPWRLRYIDLHIAVDQAGRRLAGMTTLVVDATPGAGDLLLDLGDSMTVDSARLAGPGAAEAIPGVRQPGHIDFRVPSPAGGTGYRAAVWFHGRPPVPCDLKST